ncbi:lignin-forming anionic peroxidase-like [Canna indica]|uniref:Peroxidase n=1 Tax=Canna indica TaxID=4628 RepID=A0AAQ3JMP2_9LILI|nr:lignin-forming anionic peroxidase-like [Canna indica]
MSSSKASSFNKLACLVASLLFLMSAISCEAYDNDIDLTTDYYAKSCPKALPIIKSVVRAAVAKERRMAASLVRLHFHDCFVQGCDASVLLKDSKTIISEQGALQNFKSARGFEVIDRIKSAVEKACPGVVSCADILAVAARDSSKLVRGPTWKVKLGRRDSTTANKALAEKDIPIAFNDLHQIISSFARQGLSVQDMVALSGSHTIGQAQCITFRERIHEETNIDPAFAKLRQRRCPSSPVIGNSTLAPLDAATPYSFDNDYFKNLLQRKGLLHSDQVLFNGGLTDHIVKRYSENEAAFFEDFSAAMVKMGSIKPLTGSAGQIRKVCSVVNY